MTMLLLRVSLEGDSDKSDWRGAETKRTKQKSFLPQPVIGSFAFVYSFLQRFLLYVAEYCWSLIGC